ncbi:NAD(P)H-dependent oxidoreductase [Clostridium butyricum]|uniref:NAD(P)H-dependent oxidoreductase n=1 Tax=Clostridium butyricum TaxID=1492 RepID=UPI0012B711B2|nr:NAD(P)H-dependent oxidoreductase [Clostridium butyricum]
MVKKKVLGISFGRKMSNTEVMIKHALLECEKAGYEIKFIRADDLNIHICTGCISCVIGMTTGRGKGNCVLKDDFYIIDEAVMESDAVIVGSPVYEMTPTGNFKVVCDRIGPSHDISFRKTTYDSGLSDGKDKSLLPDERSFKKRVGALVAVGGAMTENWVTFALPTMFAFPMSLGIDVVDTYKYFGAMSYEHVLGNEKVMERMSSLGQHIVEALKADNEEERTKWRGNHVGICPVCHNDMLTVSHKGMEVECPTCGIIGELKVHEGKIKVDFPDEQIARSRMTYAGKLEHSTEIRTCAVGPGQIPDLKERKQKYLHVGE